LVFFDQPAQSAATARYLTPKIATFIAGVYILHYYFKYNLSVSVYQFVVLIVKKYCNACPKKVQLEAADFAARFCSFILFA